MSSAGRKLVVGTAGHIDHGKSRLVMALSGTNPDRLPEEQARGMTIDLGFAHSRVGDCDLYFVDVPGHERFIRNMVAGAAGVDLALLVVAADDSVMPQTREHAEILSLLGIERCIVVITKMDLVDDEWADQVEADARELLERVGIAPAAVVRFSAETMVGLDDLRAALGSAAMQLGRQAAGSEWFRMPIDRAFTIHGRGTVVTGTVSHGAIARDEELELWRVALDKGVAGRDRGSSNRANSAMHSVQGRASDVSATLVRVRGLQSHHEQLDDAAGRMRLAVNLAGVAHEDVGRGCELATPGYLEATRWMDVWIASLRMPGKAPRRNLRVRLHIATAEVLAELRLMSSDSAPHDDRDKNSVSGLAVSRRGAGFAQLRTAVPIVAAWGQRFIIRDESGARTLGGGRVLRCVSRPWTVRRPPQLAGLLVLRDGKSAERVEEIIREAEWSETSAAQLACRAGMASADAAGDARRRLIATKRVIRIQSASTEVNVHVDLLAAVTSSLERRLGEHMEKNPRIPGIARGEWPGWMPRVCPGKLRSALAEWMIESGGVGLADGFVVPRAHNSAIPAEDQKLWDAMLAEFHAAAFQPPPIEALACRTEKNAKRLAELVKLAGARGKLVSIGVGIWLHGERHTELVERVVAAIRQRGPVSVADVRTLLDSSRKFVVPIVEHLDAIGVTKRTGDLRMLGPKAG